MAVKIRALSSQIQLVSDDATPILVASTNTQHSTLSALKDDLQTKVDAFNAAQAPPAQAGSDADTLLNS